MRILILFLIVAGACSRSETSEPVEKAPEPTAEEAPKPAKEAAPEPPPAPPPGLEAPIDLDAPPTVTLLDAGKAPHKALRASFEPGAKQSLRVESHWTVETVYGPLVRTKAVMPSLVYELQTEVKEASDGGAQFAFRVTKVTAKSSKEVKPGQFEAAKKVGASLEGATGSFSISPRGMVEDLTIDAPSDASLFASDMIDQVKQAIRLSNLPLPEEPIGKGAKWTATQVLEQRTAKIKHTSTFELADVKGERVRAMSEHATETPKQKLKLPGSRSGATFDLDKLEFSGESKGAWQLNQLGPASASEHTVSVFVMTATAPKRETVIMSVDTTLEIKAKP
ncbi:MAG: hypothetical protein OEM15_09130 [Myxococcales bacterium]|nr:hypothetical protein [Myxococcales bacterium]MDH3485848.1 hypothetical protein [Myxococcales bacterium]